MFEVFEKYESEVRSYCRKYPVIFNKARNSEMYSNEGERYIDFLAVAGSMNYGHNNPEIKKYIMEYLLEDNIINALDMYTEAKEDFIKTFEEKILHPRNLNYKIMFCGPTGTNAIEAALKLSRKNKKRINIISFSGAFHGMSLGSLSCTTDKASRSGANVPLNNVVFSPYCGTLDSIEYLKWMLMDDHSGIDKPAAIILETVQAEGGINIANIEWLKEIRKICTENDILMIVDDIQVGNGRTGTFFSFERANIEPDMIVMSKSISGFGLPMSILLIKPDLDIFKPAEHNGTFRGNQLSFIGGKAAIDYFINKQLDLEVKRKEEIIKNFLEKYISKIDKRITYRGIGLIWGIDFINIDYKKAINIVHRAFSNKLILEVAGRHDSVLKIMPPLTIEDNVLKEGLQILYKSIKEELKNEF